MEENNFNQEQQNLSDLVDEQFRQREVERQKSRLEMLNEQEIKEGLESRLTEFYCKKCKCDYRDYKLTPIVETDWVKEGLYIAYWKSKHKKCGTWNRRFITDRKYDPYWVKSPKMKKDRGNYYKDLVQPNQSGFEMLFSYKNK